MFSSLMRLLLVVFFPLQKHTSLLVWLISSVTAQDTQGACPDISNERLSDHNHAQTSALTSPLMSSAVVRLASKMVTFLCPTRVCSKMCAMVWTGFTSR